MRKTRLVVLLIIGIFFLSVTTIAEEITLTTYYPAPYGEYQQLYVSGNVGIGTPSPQRKLHIHESSGGPVVTQLTNTDTGSGMQDGVGFGLTIDEMAQIWMYENNVLRFATNNIERMRIDGGGNVGIGTTNPQTKLHIMGDVGIANDTPGLFGQLQVTGDNAIISIDHTGFIPSGLSTLRFTTAGSEQFSIRAGYGSWAFHSGGGVNGYTSFLGYKPVGMTENVRFRNNGDAYFSINGGNVGIGTANPGGDKLDVRGRAYASGGWQTTDADYAEWVEKEEEAFADDIIGINLATGKARRYQVGDKFIGIHSSHPAVVGNRTRETDEEMKETHILVSLLGQVDFDASQVDIEGRIVKTKDGKQIGVLLSNGKVLIGR